jgi:hypothetical protein
MLKFVKQTTVAVERSKIIIKNADQSYSTAFTTLLKDYYLHL